MLKAIYTSLLLMVNNSVCASCCSSFVWFPFFFFNSFSYVDEQKYLNYEEKTWASFFEMCVFISFYLVWRELSPQRSEDQWNRRWRRVKVPCKWRVFVGSSFEPSPSCLSSLLCFKRFKLMKNKNTNASEIVFLFYCNYATFCCSVPTCFLLLCRDFIPEKIKIRAKEYTDAM